MRKALITGATSGFGQLVATSLLSRGWFVYATGREITSRLDGWQNIQSQYKDSLCFLNLDVTSAADRTRLANEVESLDVLVNNAGCGVFGPFEDLSEDQIRRQLEVNFFGAVLLTKDLMPKLRSSKGRVINISSGFGILGFPLASVYCASKFALEGWSESLSYEVSPLGVSVCIVEPGVFETRFSGNVEWTAASEKESIVYRELISGYKNLSLKRKRGADPKIVADKIVSVAEAKTVPMRIAVGKDVNLAVFIKQFVPRQVFYKILYYFYKKTFWRS